MKVYIIMEILRRDSLHDSYIKAVFDSYQKAQKRLGELYDKDFDFYCKEYGAAYISASFNPDWYEVKGEESSVYCDIEERELE